MKRRHALIVIIAIIVAAAAFFAGYSAAPKAALAPTANVPTAKVAADKTPKPPEKLAYTMVSVHEKASSTPTVSAEYPKFPDLPDDFNAAVKGAIESRLADFRQEVSETEKTMGGSTSVPLSTYSFMTAWSPAQINGRFVSFVVRFDSYTGGANENQDIETFNYDVSKGAEVALADLFPRSADYLKEISTEARRQLTAALKKTSPDYSPDEMLKTGTEPQAENFKNFTFTDSAVTIYFPKYSVAAGAFGEQKVTIPRK